MLTLRLAPALREACKVNAHRLSVQDLRRICIGVTRLYACSAAATGSIDRDCWAPKFDGSSPRVINPFNLDGDIGKLADFLNQHRNPCKPPRTARDPILSPLTQLYKDLSIRLDLDVPGLAHLLLPFFLAVYRDLEAGHLASALLYSPEHNVAMARVPSPMFTVATARLSPYVGPVTAMVVALASTQWLNLGELTPLLSLLLPLALLCALGIWAAWGVVAKLSVILRRAQAKSIAGDRPSPAGTIPIGLLHAFVSGLRRTKDPSPPRSPPTNGGLDCPASRKRTSSSRAARVQRPSCSKRRSRCVPRCDTPTSSEDLCEKTCARNIQSETTDTWVRTPINISILICQPLPLVGFSMDIRILRKFHFTP